MSNLNRVILNGRIPNFEPVYNAGDGGDKKSFLAWTISVKRNYKGKDDKYYPEDLIKFKAFGAKADFIYKNFKAGDGLIIEGRLQKDDDYEKDGQKCTGGLSIIIENSFFADAQKIGGGKGNADGGTTTAVSRPSQDKTPTRPGAPRPGAARPGAPRPGAPRPGARK